MGLINFLSNKIYDQKITKIKIQIMNQEKLISEHLERSHLKNYLQRENIMFECGKRNFIRLQERFKHDNTKFEQILKDQTDYLEALSDVIYERELLDVSTAEDSSEHFDNINALSIRMQEIEKRINDLLGSEYENPEKELKMKGLNK